MAKTGLHIEKRLFQGHWPVWCVMRGDQCLAVRKTEAETRKEAANYEAEQQARREAANRKRSEAAKERPRAEDGTLKASSRLQPCKTLDKDNHAHEQLAKAAGTSSRTAATRGKP
jgi:hypothetical protein